MHLIRHTLSLALVLTAASVTLLPDDTPHHIETAHTTPLSANCQQAIGTEWSQMSIQQQQAAAICDQELAEQNWELAYGRMPAETVLDNMVLEPL